MTELIKQLWDKATELTDESRASTDLVLVHKLRDASVLMLLAAKEIEAQEIKYEKLQEDFELLS